MAYDIRSPKGQANEINTELCWTAIVNFFSRVKKVEIERLHDLHPADGILRDGAKKPLLLIEVKSRSDFTEEQFFDRYNAMWLITAAKLDKNIPIAKSMGVPFVGAMHIVHSRVVLLKKIWHNGVLASGIEKRKCFTQANINGGTAERLNAFIPMRDARRIAY